LEKRYSAKIVEKERIKRKNKKAQMKIQQTAFVLIAITLFFALIGMFFLNYKMSQMKESANFLKEQEAKKLVSKLANSPEFSCGSSFEGEKRGDCVDFDKIMALKKNPSYYNELWDVEGIEIKKIYPSKNKNIECNESNYPDCNKITIIASNRTGKSAYVSLCRKADLGIYTKSKCVIGEIIVKYKNF